MATTLEEIYALAEQLSPEKQREALRFMQELAETEGISKPDLPPGTPSSALLNVHFSLSEEEADAMWRVIMEDRERSIQDDL